MEKKRGPVRGRVFEFLGILFAALVAALFIRYLADLGVVPESFVLPIYAVIVLVSGYIAIRVANRILERIVEPKLGVTRTIGLKNLLELVVGIVTVVFVFAVFGINVTAALIGAGFLAIVLGLAAQQVLGNIFAGLSLLVSRPFEIGDMVKLATSSYVLTGSTYAHESEPSGFTGVVQDVGIFFTTVLLDNGIPSIFPNSVIIASLIVNYSKITLRTVRVRMDLDLKVVYDDFKSRLLDSLKKYDDIDAEKSKVQIVDVGTTTYQVVIIVWTSIKFEEPIKTLLIQEGMKVRLELTPAPPPAASLG
jgi:small conductance mechanosensitive channel